MMTEFSFIVLVLFMATHWHSDMDELIIIIIMIIIIKNCEMPDFTTKKKKSLLGKMTLES